MPELTKQERRILEKRGVLDVLHYEHLIGFRPLFVYSSLSGDYSALDANLSAYDMDKLLSNLEILGRYFSAQPHIKQEDYKADTDLATLWLWKIDNLDSSATSEDLRKWRNRSIAVTSGVGSVLGFLGLGGLVSGAIIASWAPWVATEGITAALIAGGYVLLALAGAALISAIPLTIWAVYRYKKYKKMEAAASFQTKRSAEFARLFAAEHGQEVASEALKFTAMSRNRQYIFGEIIGVLTGVVAEGRVGQREYRARISSGRAGADYLLMQVCDNPVLWQDKLAEPPDSGNLSLNKAKPHFSNFLASKEQREKWLDELVSLIRNNPPLHIEVTIEAAGPAAAPPYGSQLVPTYARKMALMMMGKIFAAIDVYAGTDISETQQVEPSRPAKEGLITNFGAMFRSAKGQELLLESLGLDSENELFKEALCEVWKTIGERLDRKKECLHIVKALLMAASKITGIDTRQRVIQNILRQYNSFMASLEMEQEKAENLNPMENKLGRLNEVTVQAGPWIDQAKKDEITAMYNCAPDGIFSNILQVFYKEGYDRAKLILDNYLREIADLRDFSAEQSMGKQKFFANILELKLVLDQAFEQTLPAEAAQTVMVGEKEVQPVVFAKAVGLRYLATLTELTADADEAQREALYTAFGTEGCRYDLLGRLTDDPWEFREALSLMKDMLGDDLNIKNVAFDSAIKALLIGLSAKDEEEGRKRIKLVLRVYNEEMIRRSFKDKSLAEINFNAGQERIDAILSHIQFPIAQFRSNRLLLEKISEKVNRVNVFLWIAERFNCSEEEQEAGRNTLKEFLGAVEVRSYPTLLATTWNTPKVAKVLLQKDIENIIHVFSNVPGLEEATDLAAKQRNIARNTFARAMAIRYLSAVAQKINGIENSRNKTDAKKAFREILGSESNRVLFSGLLEEKRIPEVLTPVLEEIWAMERGDVPEQLEHALNNCFEDMKVILGSLVRLGREKEIPQVVKAYEEFVVGKIMQLGVTVEETKRKHVLLLDWTGKITQWLATPAYNDNSVFTFSDKAKIRAQYIKAESIFTLIAKKYAGIPAKDGYEQVPGDPKRAILCLKTFLGDGRRIWDINFLGTYIFQSINGDLTVQLTRWVNDLSLAIQYSLEGIVVNASAEYLSPSLFNRFMALKLLNKLWVSINAIDDSSLEKRNMIRAFYSVLANAKGKELVKQLLGEARTLPENLSAIFNIILNKERFYEDKWLVDFAEDKDDSEEKNADERKIAECLSVVKILLLQLSEARKFDLIPQVLKEYNKVVIAVNEHVSPDRQHEFLFTYTTEISSWLASLTQTERPVLPTAKADKILDSYKRAPSVFTIIQRMATEQEFPFEGARLLFNTFLGTVVENTHWNESELKRILGTVGSKVGAEFSRWIYELGDMVTRLKVKRNIVGSYKEQPLAYQQYIFVASMAMRTLGKLYADVISMNVGYGVVDSLGAASSAAAVRPGRAGENTSLLPQSGELDDERNKLIRNFKIVLQSSEGKRLLEALGLDKSLLSDGLELIWEETLGANEIKQAACFDAVKTMLIGLSGIGFTIMGWQNQGIRNVMEAYNSFMMEKFEASSSGLQNIQVFVASDDNVLLAPSQKNRLEKMLAIVTTQLSPSQQSSSSFNQPSLPKKVTVASKYAPLPETPTSPSSSPSSSPSPSVFEDESTEEIQEAAAAPIQEAAVAPIGVAEISGSVIASFSDVEKIYAESVRRMGRENVRGMQVAFKFKLQAIIGKVISNNPIDPELSGIIRKIIMAQKLQSLVSPWLRGLFENIKQIDLVNEEEYSLKRNKYNLICQDILVVYLLSIMSCKSNFEFSSEITTEIVDYIEKAFSLINLEGHVEISKALFDIKQAFISIQNTTGMSYLDFVYTMQLLFNSAQILDDRKKLLVKLITGLMEGSTEQAAQEGAINITEMVHKILCAYIRSSYCPRIYNDSDADILKFENFNLREVRNAESPLQKLKNSGALRDVFTEVLELFDGVVKEQVSFIFDGFFERFEISEAAQSAVVHGYASYSSYSSSLSPPLPQTPPPLPPRSGITSQAFFAGKPAVPEQTQHRPSSPLLRNDSAAPSSVEGLTLPALGAGLGAESEEPPQDASSGLTSQQLSSSSLIFFTAPPDSADDSSAEKPDSKYVYRSPSRLSDASKSPDVPWPDSLDPKNK